MFSEEADDGRFSPKGGTFSYILDFELFSEVESSSPVYPSSPSLQVEL
jgi:hypothetical protein